MFEGLVSSILVRLLGEYIEDIDPKSLDIGIWKGKVDLDNLRLKSTALDVLDLPISVVHGFVGNINASIPWSSLGSQPVVAQITDIFMVVQPKKCVPWNAKAEKEKEMAVKRRQLEAYEAAKNTQTVETTESKDSFGSRLAETIIHNIQVRIRNVHVRYEDTSDPLHPVCFGLVLSGLDIQSTDENWKSTFIKTIDKAVHKVMVLRSISVYMNHDDPLLFTKMTPNTQFVDEMRKWFATSSVMRVNVVPPINGSMRLRMKLTGESDTSEPQYTFDLWLDDVSVTLNDRQYRSLVEVTDYIMNYKSIDKFRRHKPTEGLDTEEGRLNWWRFALRGLHSHFNNKFFSWEMVEDRLLKRDEYIQLYKRSKAVTWLEPLDPLGIDRLRFLEEWFDLESLLYFRELGQAEVNAERQMYEKTMKSSPQKSKGWFSSWGSNANKPTLEEPQQSFELTDEERQQLYDKIGYNAREVATKATLPLDYTKVMVTIRLKGGTIKIVKNGEKPQPILKCQYSNFVSNVGIRESSTVVKVSLGEVNAYDCVHETTQFKRVLGRGADASPTQETLVVPVSPITNTLSVSPIANTLSVSPIVAVSPVTSLSPTPASTLTSTSPNTLAFQAPVKIPPLVQITVETNPVAQAIKSDMYVHVKLERTEIVMNVPLIQQILSFLLDESITAAASKLSNDSSFKRKVVDANTELKVLLETRKVWDINLLILAPTFIFPHIVNNSNETNALLFDLGKLHFNILSLKDREDALRRVKNEVPTKDDFYDRYALDMNDIRVVHAVLLDGGFERKKIGADLLDKVDVSLVVHRCLVPQASPTYANTIIDGIIPRVNIDFSPAKFSMLVHVANTIMELSDNPTGHNASIIQKGELKLVKGKKHMSDRTRKQYQVELHDDGYISLFAQENNVPVQVASLNMIRNGVMVFDDQHDYGARPIGVVTSIDDIKYGLKMEEFCILLPRARDNKDITLILAAADEDEKLKWCTSLRDVIRTQGHFESGETVEHVETNKTKLTVSLRMNDISLSLGHEQKLTEIKFDNLKLDLANKAHDTRLGLSVASLEMIDLRREVPKTVLSSAISENLHNLVEIEFIYIADPKSTLADGSADKILNLNFDKVWIVFEPIFVSSCTNFLYELGDSLSELSSRVVSLSAKPESHEEKREGGVKVHAALTSADLTLVSRGATSGFVKLSMDNASIDFITHAKGTLLQGRIGNLFGKHLSERTCYPEVLGLVNSDSPSVVSFSYESLPVQDDTKHHYASKLKIDLESIKLVYLGSIVRKVIAFFTTGPMRDSIGEGARKATNLMKKTASQEVSLGYMQWDVTFKNPIIVLPASYVSSDYILGNLGEIRITNSILDETIPRQLYDIQFSAMSLITNIDDKQCDVVAKADLKAKVIRRLDDKIDDIVANTATSIVISEVSMHLTHHQYQIFYRVWNDNLGDADVAESIAEVGRDAREYAQKITEDLPQVKTRSTLDVSFPHLNLSVARDTRENPLACLDMYGLIYTWKSTGITEVGITSAEARDLRTEVQSAFRTIIDTSKSKQARFIHVLVTSDETRLLTRSIIHMGDPRIVFDPALVYEVWDWFAATRNEEAFPLSPMELENSNVSTKEFVAEPIYTYKVDFDMGTPSIIIPANQQDENSRLLILTLDGVYSSDSKAPESNTRLTVRNLNIFIEKEREHAETTVTVPLVEPFGFIMENSATTIDKLTTMETQLTLDHDIRARVSFRDALMIESIMSTISSSGVAKVAEEIHLPTLNVPKDSSGQFNIAQFVESPTNPDAIPLITIDTTAKKAKEELHRTYKLTPECNSREISVLIVDDVNLMNHVPLFEVCITDLRVLKYSVIQLDGATKSSTQDVIIRFGFNYYNMLFADWEPIIEPSLLRIYYDTELTKSKITIKDVDTKLSQEHHLGRSDSLSINISNRMTKTILNTVRAWNDAHQAPIPDKMFYPYILRNHCGYTVHLTLHDHDNEESTVSVGDEYGFVLQQKRNSIHWRGTESSITIAIPELCDRVFVLNVRKTQHATVMSRGNHMVMVQVELEGGRRIITVKSCVGAVNRTDTPIELAWATEGLPQTFSILQPGATCGIPVNDATLLVKPINGEWCPRTNLTITEMIKKNKSVRVIVCGKHHIVMRVGCLSKLTEQEANGLKEHPQKYQHLPFQLEFIAPLCLENLLSCAVTYEAYDGKVPFVKGSLESGERAYLYGANLQSTERIIARIQPKDWKKTPLVVLYAKDKDHTALGIGINYLDAHNRPVTLMYDHEKCEDSDGTSALSYHHVVVYTRFWLVNRTSVDMSFRDSRSRENGFPLQKNALLPFSFEPNAKLCLKANNSEWSTPLGVGQVGIGGDVSMTDQDRRYAIGFYTGFAPGKYARTRIVTFSPRYVITNQTQHVIGLKQAQGTSVRLIQPNDRLNYFWREKQVKTKPFLHLSIREEENKYRWATSQIRTDVLGESYIKLMRVSDRGAVVNIIRADVREDMGSIVVSLDEPDTPPYLIDNRLGRTVSVSQKGIYRWWSMPAKAKTAYAWDDVNSGQQILCIKTDRDIIEVDINRVSDNAVPIFEGKALLKVSIKGSTRIVRINDSKQKVVAKKTQQKGTSMSLTMVMKSIGISIIDSSQEVAFVLLEGTNFKYYVDEIQQSVEVVLGRIQIDNQARDASIPVIFANRNELKDKPMLHVSICRSLKDSTDTTKRTLYNLPYLSISMQEATIQTDYSFVKHMMHISNHFYDQVQVQDEKAILDTVSYAPPDQHRTYFYCDRLELHPIRVNLTFRFNRTSASDDTEDGTLKGMLDAIGFTLAVDDAPVKLNALLLEHPFLTADQLYDRLRTHYRRCITTELYKLLGSLEVIGNPVGLFNDIGTGVRDFFYEPAMAITESPEELGRGLARGSKSLLSNTLRGTMNSVSTVSGTLARGMSLLSMDDDHMRRMDRDNASRPESVSDGLEQGRDAIIRGFYEGVTDIFNQPKEGLEKEGGLGLLKGIGKGLLGVPTKSVGGLLDGLNKVTRGISNSQQTRPVRTRLPRAFRDDGAIIAYDVEHAVALDVHYNLLQQTELGPTVGATLVSYLYTPSALRDSKNLFLITDKALIKIDLKDEKAIEWSVALDNIIGVSRNDSGAVICEMKKRTSGTSKVALNGYSSQANDRFALALHKHLH